MGSQNDYIIVTNSQNEDGAGDKSVAAPTDTGDVFKKEGIELETPSSIGSGAMPDDTDDFKAALLKAAGIEIVPSDNTDYL